jgi:hypothetical protein
MPRLCGGIPGERLRIFEVKIWFLLITVLLYLFTHHASLITVLLTVHCEAACYLHPAPEFALLFYKMQFRLSMKSMCCGHASCISPVFTGTAASGNQI